MHPTRQKILDKAVSQIGNPDPDIFWRVVLATFRPGGQKGMAWCGGFALWVLHMCGVTTRMWKIGFGFLLVPPGLPRTNNPEAGDIAYFDRPFQHHALVDSISGETLYTVDGNQGAPNTVRRKERLLVPRDAVQRALNTFDPPAGKLKDDGVMGPKSRAALAWFQSVYLPDGQTGLVDLPTVRALGLKPTAIFFSIAGWLK